MDADGTPNSGNELDRTPDHNFDVSVPRVLKDTTEVVSLIHRNRRNNSPTVGCF